jgi:hypothetical protein
MIGLSIEEIRQNTGMIILVSGYGNMSEDGGWSVLGEATEGDALQRCRDISIWRIQARGE